MRKMFHFIVSLFIRPALEVQNKQKEIKRLSDNAWLLYLGFSVFTLLTMICYSLDAFSGLVGKNWLMPKGGFIIYNFLLFTYVSSKEIVRWSKLKQTTHRGGRWVILWLGFSFMILISSILVEKITMPIYLPWQTGGVLVAFFASEALKTAFIKRMLIG